MSIDLQPFSALAPEPAPPAAAREGQTLTLSLSRRIKQAGDAAAAMRGTLAIRVAPAAPPGTVSAGVVAVDATPLTITF